MPAVFEFPSTGEAYNASQTHDEIRDGDVLSVPSEGVVGIMVEAWPTAISEEHGEFHTLMEGVVWTEVPRIEGGTKNYGESLALAIEVLTEQTSGGD
jgi:hypothetical protein